MYNKKCIIIFRLYTVRMDQSDLFPGGHLFHLENPPGPIVNLPDFLVYLPGKILILIIIVGLFSFNIYVLIDASQYLNSYYL